MRQEPFFRPGFRAERAHFRELQRTWSVVEDWQSRENVRVLQNCDVIGMTTTGAAKNRRILSKLDCKLVLVEEAAQAGSFFFAAS